MELDPPFLSQLQISIGETEPPSDEYFDFLRWALVENPEGIGHPSRLIAAMETTRLLGQWLAGV